MPAAQMSLSDLKDLFSPAPTHFVSPDGLSDFNKATHKKHRHAHNPARKPKKGRISPAEYRRRHLGKQ